MDASATAPKVAPPPVALIGPVPTSARNPIVLASPHSGRQYPPEFVAASRLALAALRQSEDSFVDELFGDAPFSGIPLLAATFPRAYCDVNRERWELDPGMFADPLPTWCTTGTARVAAGYGSVPRVAGGRERIYRDKLLFSEAAERIERCWVPYHQALAGLVESTRTSRGACLLIDCHSMPGAGAAGGSTRADIVLGDNHGRSCDPALIGMVETVLARHGLRTRRNDPYAGGYVTQHYGRPEQAVHVLQLEVARGLYLDERSRESLTGFGALRRTLSSVVATLGALPGLVPHAR